MLSMNPAGGEVWYSLRPVDNASEVHGQLHLKILATKHVSTGLYLHCINVEQKNKRCLVICQEKPQSLFVLFIHSMPHDWCSLSHCYP